MSLGTINERRAITVAVRLVDESGSLWTPTTLEYRIDCQTTGKEILGWSSLTASDTASIAVTASQNAIQNNANPREVKVLTISANRGTDTESPDEVTWTVRNLQGIT